YGADAVIIFGEPSVVGDTRQLAYVASGERITSELRFCEFSLVDSRLRGQVLSGSVASPLADEPGEVLALLDGRPVWWARGPAGHRVDVVGDAPAELGELESLREVCRTQAAAMIPLVHL